jgi:hypothetical protein
MHSVTIYGEIVIPPVPGKTEHRRRPRHLCEASAVATILRPELLFRGTIRNISEVGCYFESPARLSLEPATVVDLRFKLNDERYRTRALVRNNVPGRGMGLEFAFTSGQEQNSIRNLIRTFETEKLAKAL